MTKILKDWHHFEMKAATFNSYGPPSVVHITEIPTPAPKEHEVLVKVVATTVTSADCRIRAMNIPSKLFEFPARLIFGVFKPRLKVLGTELSGTVSSVGAKVTSFKPGDHVVVGPGAGMGAHAEYVCVKESGAICLKPDSLSFTEAAAVSFGGSTALVHLRDMAKVKPGDSVLVYGASGNVGTFSVQVAKHMGAHVTAVCSSKNAALVKSLGADVVLPYDASNFMSELSSGGGKYDLIFDTVGKITFSEYKKFLKPNGKFMAAVLTGTEVLQMIFNNLFFKQKVLGGVAVENKKDLQHLLDLTASCAIKPVVDKTFSFSSITDAHTLVDSGRKRGSVVVTI